LPSEKFSIFSNADHDCFKLDHEECGIRHPIEDLLVEHVVKVMDDSKKEKNQLKQSQIDKDEKYIVEYSFIDFEFLILGQKIVHYDLDDGDKPPY